MLNILVDSENNLKYLIVYKDPKGTQIKVQHRLVSSSLRRQMILILCRISQWSLLQIRNTYQLSESGSLVFRDVFDINEWFCLL